MNIIDNCYFYLECKCDLVGSSSTICDSNGACTCNMGYAGDKCDECAPDYFKVGSNCTGKSFMLHNPA